MNAFFNSQFNYCPVIWMYHSRVLNNKINRLHERCLRIIYNDKTYSFNNCLYTLHKYSSSIHYTNIQALYTTQIFKLYTLHKYSSSIHYTNIQALYTTQIFKLYTLHKYSSSIHYTNIQALAIEMYKVTNGMFPVIMYEIFQLREESHYNLRFASNFNIPSIHRVYHGSEFASYLGTELWELIPPVFRQIESFDEFKK